MRLGFAWLRSAVAAALCLVATAAALAEPSQATAILELTRGPGAESCVGRALLQTSVEKRLKRRVFVPAGERPTLKVRVQLARRGSEHVARIVLADPDDRPRGERTLATSARHCSALDDSLALAIALLVDAPPDPEPEPNPATELSAPSAAAAQTPGPRAAVTPSSTLTIPAEVLAPREPWHLGLEASAAVGWGMLPDFALAISVGARLSPPGFSPLLLEGQLWLPDEQPRPSGSGSGARFRLIRAGLRVCPPLLSGPVSELGLCLGQELGWLRVEGYGFDHDASDARLTYALSARAEFGFRVAAPLRLRAGLGGEVPFVRDRFVSGGNAPAELFRPAPVAVLLGIGAEVELR